MAKPYSDPRGRHIRVYVDEVMDSPAYRALSWPARALFFDLRANLGKTNNGDLMASLMGRPNGKGLSLYDRGWRSPSTLASALYELRSAGFLVQTRAGGVESGSKVCALYAFTDVDIFEKADIGLTYQKATHAYRAHATVTAAKTVIREGSGALHAAAIAKKDLAKARKKEKTTLREMERDATGNGAMHAVDATGNGADTSVTLRKMEQKKRPPNRAVARVNAGFSVAAAPEVAQGPTATDSVHLCITATPAVATAAVAAVPATGLQGIQGARVASASKTDSKRTRGAGYSTSELMDGLRARKGTQP